MIRQYHILLSCCIAYLFTWQTLYAQLDSSDVKLDALVHRGINNLQTDAELQRALTECKWYIQQFSQDRNVERKARVKKARLLKSEIHRKMGSGQIDIAISELLSALENSPNDADLNRELGLSYMALDKPEEARIYLGNAVQLNNQDLTAWRALVELNEEDGSIEQRIFAYEGYLVVDPPNARNWTKLGEVYLLGNRKADAENSFVQAIKKDSRQTIAHIELAKIKRDRGDWAGVVAEYNAILGYDPTNALANAGLDQATPHLEKERLTAELLNQGTKALQLSDYRQWERAEKSFKKLLESVDPENQEAKEGYLAARKKLYDHWFSQGLRQSFKNAKKDLELTLKCFTVSLVYADDDVDRDSAFVKQKETAFKLNTEIKYSNARDAADAALKSGEFRKALESLAAAEFLRPSSASESDPTRMAAEIGENYNRGIEELTAGRYSLAKDYFKKVLEKNPDRLDAKEKFHEAARQDSIQFLTNLFQQAKARRDWHSSRVYLRELISLSPNDSKYQEELRVVEKAISRQEVWYPISIFVLVAGGLISVFLLLSSGFRNGFLGLFNRIANFFPRIRYGNIVAVIVVSFVGFLYYILLSQKIVPGLQTLSGRTILGGIAILIFVVAMAFIRKRIAVRFQTRAKRVSFLLQESTNLLQHPLAIESLQMKSIVGLVIEKGMLRRKEDGALLAEDNIHFRPYSATAIANIEFQAIETQFFVNDLNFSQGSRMFFEKEGRKIAVTLQGSNGPNSFELPEKFFMKVSGCEIVCNGHTIEKASINKPITFLVELLASRPAIQYWVGNGPSSFILNSIKTSTARNNNTPYLLARRIKNLSSKEKEMLIGSPIAEFSSSDHDYSMGSGTYEILLRGGEKGELNVNSRCLLTPNLFDKIKIGIGYEPTFDLQYEGRFSSFQIEHPSDDRVEKIPPALNWLVDEKRTLILVLTFAFGLIGFIISVLDLADR